MNNEEDEKKSSPTPTQTPEQTQDWEDEGGTVPCEPTGEAHDECVPEHPMPLPPEKIQPSPGGAPSPIPPHDPFSFPKSPEN